jgi:hypothetical protein
VKVFRKLNIAYFAKVKETMIIVCDIDIHLNVLYHLHSGNVIKLFSSLQTFTAKILECLSLTSTFRKPTPLLNYQRKEKVTMLTNILMLFKHSSVLLTFQAK